MLFFNSEVAPENVKNKAHSKTLFSETIETHFMYYVSTCPSSHEFRATIKSQIGPHYSQNKVSIPSFVMIIRLCQYSICTSATSVRARVRRSARRNDARQLRYAQICTFYMQYLTVSISIDRSKTGFELSAKKWSRSNCTYNVYSSIRKSRF
jgi:hypothetical protein